MLGKLEKLPIIDLIDDIVIKNADSKNDLDDLDISLEQLKDSGSFIRIVELANDDGENEKLADCNKERERKCSGLTFGGITKYDAKSRPCLKSPDSNRSKRSLSNGVANHKRFKRLCIKSHGDERKVRSNMHIYVNSKRFSFESEFDQLESNIGHNSKKLS